MLTRRGVGAFALWMLLVIAVIAVGSAYARNVAGFDKATVRWFKGDPKHDPEKLEFGPETELPLKGSATFTVPKDKTGFVLRVEGEPIEAGFPNTVTATLFDEDGEKDTELVTHTVVAREQPARRFRMTFLVSCKDGKVAGSHEAAPELYVKDGEKGAPHRRVPDDGEGAPEFWTIKCDP